jgi:hypothetical protein
MSEHTIPSNAVIPCPALTFRSRFASACGSCDHFRGVIEVIRNAREGTPSNERYRIACAHPVARRFELVEGAANAGAE